MRGGRSHRKQLRHLVGHRSWTNLRQEQSLGTVVGESHLSTFGRITLNLQKSSSLLVDMTSQYLANQVTSKRMLSIEV